MDKSSRRKNSEIETGNVKVIPGNEVFNEIKEKYVGLSFPICRLIESRIIGKNG